MAFEVKPRAGANFARGKQSMLVALSLAGASVLSLAACDSRAGLTPELVVEAFGYQPDNPVTNPKDVTSETCGAEIPCEEAIRADEIAVYSFDSKADAADFARSLGDNGYQSNWIVLEYAGAAADTDRSKASYASTLDGMWSTD